MKKRLITGLQPTGNLTIGNYAGSIKQVIDMSNDYDVFLFVADLHALTGEVDPAELRKNSRENLALYLAAGVDSEKSTIFLQSHISEHSELAYVLLCNSTMGDMSRMTQFKDKSSKFKQDNGTLKIPTGILIYPGLMASDILLYDADIIPVGKDQKQHVELARDLAEKMNKKYGNLFKMPEPKISEDQSSKIMSLLDPTKKMSKSDENKDATIFLLDSADEIERKIKKAVTDSENIIKYDPINKPGVSNLMTLINLVTNEGYLSIEKRLEGSHYGVLKNEATKSINSLLGNIQKEYNKIIISDKIDEILNSGYKVAKPIAKNKLQETYEKIGLVSKEKR